MTASKIKTPKGRTDLLLELTATLPNGVVVPTEVFIVYPEGMGFHAVKSVQKMMAENINQIFGELLQRKDASLVEVMLASRADEDDES